MRENLKKARALWAVFILLVGQIHLCHAEYVRPGGEACGDCAQELSSPPQAELSSSDSCLDCCSIEGCKEKQRSVARFALSASLAAAFVGRVVVLPPLPLGQSLRDPHLFLEADPAHAPPPLLPSRAPPVPLS